ncbi:DMT family transporter [Chitinibacter sp. S2-10]|uniref:DMT family transporter n=1 Tax=Chitinibacter sp. S2-10 TaxID=3373597 RepID=UPI003977CE0E
MKQRILLLTTLTMIAFAANSILCRLALKQTSIDAASFTTIRLISGALMLSLIIRGRDGKLAGNWRSALALFAYAACFSFSYLSLPASTGALLLFGAVQTTMLAYGFGQGERFLPRQWLGISCAIGGLIVLLLPGLTMPPLQGALLMLISGLAWGIYSLRAKGSGDPTCATAGNFVRASVFAIVLVMFQALFHPLSIPLAGLVYALLSGAIASGLGYAIWYTVLRDLNASSAATVQLSVPVLAALGGVILLGEILSLRLVISAIAILGGIALVISTKH